MSDADLNGAGVNDPGMSGAGMRGQRGWPGARPPRTRLLAALHSRWIEWRNHRIASAAFQGAVTAFPLTRPIVRRHAQALFDMCAGFVCSQVLLAFVRLGLDRDLAQDGPQTAAQIAARKSLPEPAAARLLDAAVALRLAQRMPHGRFAAGALGAALAGNLGLRAMIEHNTLLYADLTDPVALLQRHPDGNLLGRFWPYANQPEPGELSTAETSGYTELMSASQPMIAADVLSSYPCHRHRHLMDVGGGDGSFLIQAAEALPALRLTLFDLPSVAQRARDRFAACGLAGRVHAQEGDFRTDALPQGADLITLNRICLDHEDRTVLSLLRAARAALEPGGSLLIAEPMPGTRHAESVAAYFAIYLFAIGNGRLRRSNEVVALARQAGFRRSRVYPTRQPMLVRVLALT